MWECKQVSCPSEEVISNSLQGKLEWSNLTKTRLRHGRYLPVSWPMDLQSLAGFIIRRVKFVISWWKTTCGAEHPVFLRRCVLLTALSEKVCCSLPVYPLSPPQRYPTWPNYPHVSSTCLIVSAPFPQGFELTSLLCQTVLAWVECLLLVKF